MVRLQLVQLMLFLVAFLLSVGKESFAFTPSDNYLIVCGSSKNVTFQDRSFIPDSQHSKVELETTESTGVIASKYSPPSLYQSA